jgi:Xaa-Pro aminopeptidase
MIVSNEPGYYRAGAFGIRCENLLVVRESGREGGDLAMLEFDAITLVPFDLRLVDAGLMTQAELAWLNNYHQRVAATVGPLLTGADREWLERATRPLAA